MSLTPEIVLPLLTGRFGRPYLHAERCESTQLLLDSSLPEGATAVAEEQTAGRGRLGRSWEARRGSAILCSVLLKPPGDRPLPELSLVAGVAVAVELERALDLAVQVKWPNDVMLRREKVVGILAEARDGVVVLGIGVNVNQTREQLPPRAGSLRSATGRKWERAPLLVSLLAGLGQAYEAWLADGLDALYSELGARDFLRGRQVTVDGLTGTAVKIDRRGRLEVELGGRIRTIESGEATFER